MDSSRVWIGMLDLSDKMLLGKSKPNSKLVEEALSFDANRLDTISTSELRKYIVVLGQYLISLQFEENRAEAEYSAWSKSLDASVYSSLRSCSDPEFKSIKTITEKRAWVLEKDEEVSSLDAELQVADARRKIIKNMVKPVEQYINTLKKEIDSRSGERKVSYE